ncbi:MAG: T9SS type A sorting domain-containing protein, partial [Flavobacteriales bacterium]|nr:T9SS type A sorting domain-containing protein [Flavobacteriales bacterium]
VVHPTGCVATKAKNYNSSKSNTSSINTSSDLSVAVASADAAAGVCDGEVAALVSGGDAPYTYLWDDLLAQTTDTATGLCPGAYTVMVIDANGDSATTTGYVGQAGVTITAITTSTNAGAGLCDGTASVTATGGIEPYSYVWDGNTGSQLTQIATGLCPGTYSVIVLDSLGNMTTVFVTVGEAVGIGQFVRDDINLSINPNPFNDKTEISYELSSDANVVLEVFNLMGERVSLMAEEDQTPGEFVYIFSKSGEQINAGIYIVALRIDGIQITRRIIALR